MSVVGAPQIESADYAEDWTKVTFEPDFKKFKMSGLNDDTV